MGMRYAWGSAPISVAQQVEAALKSARHSAVNRMVQECEGLRGDGIVGVRLTMEPFVAGGIEVQAIGTAVRADGDKRPPRPFTSDLTGQDFAKLILAGWLPTGLVMGTASSDPARRLHHRVAKRLVEQHRSQWRHRSGDQRPRAGSRDIANRCVALRCAARGSARSRTLGVPPRMPVWQ